MIDSEAPESRLHQHVPNEILQLDVLLMQMKESNSALQIMKSLFLSGEQTYWNSFSAVARH